MPGMMDTVLNLGLNDRTVLGLARWTKNERFAWDCYRRFITIFGDVVLAIDRHAFDELLDRAKAQAGARTDADLQPEPLKALVAEFKRLVQARTGKAFPQDPVEQLRLAVSAVFDSWFAKKAVDYRRINRLPDDWGTAVTVMAMVERRAALLRRVPRQRPGRRRGGGHPHAAADRGAQGEHAQGI
jgi:pyruvate,orthophosphate dikinase